MPRTIRYGSTSRPHWSFHPACLFCNWDDDRDHDCSASAEHLGERPIEDQWTSPIWPTANYAHARRYVAAVALARS